MTTFTEYAEFDVLFLVLLQYLGNPEYLTLNAANKYFRNRLPIREIRYPHKHLSWFGELIKDYHRVRNASHCIEKVTGQNPQKDLWAILSMLQSGRINQLDVLEYRGTMDIIQAFACYNVPIKTLKWINTDVVTITSANNPFMYLQSLEYRGSLKQFENISIDMMPNLVSLSVAHNIYTRDSPTQYFLNPTESTKLKHLVYCGKHFHHMTRLLEYSPHLEVIELEAHIWEDNSVFHPQCAEEQFWKNLREFRCEVYDPNNATLSLPTLNSMMPYLPSTLENLSIRGLVHDGLVMPSPMSLKHFEMTLRFNFEDLDRLMATCMRDLSRVESFSIGYYDKGNDPRDSYHGTQLGLFLTQVRTLRKLSVELFRVEHVADALIKCIKQNADLSTLSLRCTETIHPRTFFWKALGTATSLQNLDLGYLDLSNDDLSGLVPQLSKLHRLSRLMLDYNYFTDNSIPLVVQLIESLPCLKELNLDFSEFTEGDILAPVRTLAEERNIDLTLACPEK